MDRDQAVTDVSTMDHRLTTRLAARQISMLLLGMFATLAMALGLYLGLSRQNTAPAESRLHGPLLAVSNARG